MKVIVCVTSVFVRVGLRAIADDLADMSILADTDDYSEALCLAAKDGTDVVIIFDDTIVRRPQALEALAKAHASRAVRIVALVGDLEPPQLRDLLANGVRAIVYSDEPAEHLADAVRAAAVGGIYISPNLAGLVTNMILAIKPNDSYARLRIRGKLTPREAEVFEHVVRGQANQEIAAELNVSEKTVKFHVSSILAKLAVNSRAQLIALAANVAGRLG